MRRKSRKVRPSGHLKYKGIGQRTHDRYKRQLQAFFTHLQLLQIPLPNTLHDLDQQLAEHINDMYQNGEPHGYAGDLISAVSRAMPRARAHIPTARLWFRNWTREIKRCRALPIPVHAIKGLAGLGLAFDRLDLAALLPAAFICMLRTSEIYSLQCQHVVFSPDGTKAIIVLPHTKTSGLNMEESIVHDRIVVAALRKACEHLKPGDTLYSRPARFFGEDLRWLAALVGFRHERLLPYSLRRGGATWHMHKYGSLSLTALLGRWKNDRTAKIYIDGAAAEWATWQLGVPAERKLERCSKLYTKYFAS